MGLHGEGEGRASARLCRRPSPFLSSPSTELTFKLWHQLPCQTRCDFPSLHLPSLLLAPFLLLLLSPPSFPLTPPPSSDPTAASSGVPIHSMPASREALLQVGIASIALAAPPPLPPPPPPHAGTLRSPKSPLPGPALSFLLGRRKPSHQPLPDAGWPSSFCLLPQLPQPHPSQKPQAGMYSPFNVHLHLAPGRKYIFCLPL